MLMIELRATILNHEAKAKALHEARAHLRVQLEEAFRSRMLARARAQADLTRRPKLGG
jgi:hypothetical protein